MFLLLSGTAGAQWVQSSGPYGGVISSVVSNQTGIYAGGYGVGVFKSTDKGESWISCSSGLAPFHLLAMAANGTGIVVSTQSGLFISTDGGNSWHPAESGPPQSSSSSLSVSGSAFIASGGSQVYISLDGGMNWSPADSGMPAGASGISVAVLDSAIFAAIYGYGIYELSTVDTVWNKVSSDTSVAHALYLYAAGTTLFALTDRSFNRSTDGGKSWMAASSPGFMSQEFARLGRYIFDATYDGVFVSTDEGADWSAVNAPFFSANIPSLVCDEGTLIAGTESGVYVSADSGKTWVERDSGLAAMSVNSLEENENVIYAGTYSGGVFISGDGGLTWSRTALPYGRVYNLAVDSSRVFAGATYDSNGMFVSAGPDQAWSQLKNYPAQGGASAFGVVGNRLFAVGPHSGYTFSTTDFGESWSSSYPQYNLSSFTSLGDKIFAGSYGRGVVVSADSGKTWENAETGLTNLNVPCIAASDSTLFAGTDDGVFVSPDGGASWKAANSGMQGYTIQCILVDEGAIFAGTYGHGIFMSSDDGANWTAIDQGLGDQYIYSLAIINPGTIDDVKLLAGTNSGVWHRTLSQLVPDAIKSIHGNPVSFRLDQNYPNPFNPTTAISYQLSTVSHVTLKVYDVLGREVATLVDGHQSPGTHSVVFDGSKFASGVYFYRLNAGGSTQVRKMVLMK